MSLLTRRRLDNAGQFDDALAGKIPGEALSAYDRRVLVSVLHSRGYSDRQIADRTQWTLYTTARIRDHIGLDPNLHTEQPVVLAG